MTSMTAILQSNQISGFGGFACAKWSISTSIAKLGLKRVSLTPVNRLMHVSSTAKECKSSRASWMMLTVMDVDTEVDDKQMMHFGEYGFHAIWT